MHDAGAKALDACGIDRSEVFITTKVHRQELAYDDVLLACDRALEEIKTEYLDLYLVHWPNADMPMKDTFRATGRLIEEGKVRDMGAANFTRLNLQRALDAAQSPIAVNQVEFHPYLNQVALLEFCHAHDIQVTAYAPIAQARVLEDRTLQAIGAAHGRNPIQISLRWLIQKGLAAIPKATSRSHLEANFDVFDFSLSLNEMDQIECIETSFRLFDWEAAAEFSKDCLFEQV